ncbi:Epidermal growth factor receptor kinase substrate 8 [Aphelenchoides besseyi]|nr:Epidermal growth factor receptor kinase substrate 8 [Aphelenchoides besseyi]
MISYQTKKRCISLTHGVAHSSRHHQGPPSSGPSYYYTQAPPQAHASTRSLNQTPSGATHSPHPIHHTASAASSPAQPVTHTYRTVTTTKLDPPHRSGTLPTSTRRSADRHPPTEMEPPAFFVEHLASFAVGRQFGLQTPADGIRKLKQMEQNSAIWPQPLILKLYPDRISVEEENGELVEQFAMDLVIEPTAHQSNDPQEVFNNILLFVVKEDQRNGRRSMIPTEMHFTLDVNTTKVRPGRREPRFASGPPPSANIPPPAPTTPLYGATPDRASTGGHASRRDYREEPPATNGTDYFEYDVNTLNRCFDDIERFVARIQSAAIAQRELEIQNHRLRSQKSKNKAHDAAFNSQHGILQLRAQLPNQNEFYDILQKFKLCFNLLAKLKNHIHDPNAPELLHFLFTPLSVIVDATQWGLGRNIAETVLSPLLSFDACELLRNCLTSKEIDLWMMLGKAWRTPPEDWPGPLPPAYRPTFNSNFAAQPYGYPPNNAYDVGPPLAAGRYPPPSAVHRGASAPPAQQNFPPPQQQQRGGAPFRERSFDNLDVEKVNFEKEKLEFEKRKVREREARLQEDERRLRQEAARLDAERRLLHREAEKQSIAGSDRPDFYRRDDYSAHPSPRVERRMGSVQALSNGHVPPPVTNQSSAYNSPQTNGHAPPQAHTNGRLSPVPAAPIPLAEQSPRQRAFIDELLQKQVKAVQVAYDRVAQNPKELSVIRGEYLEVLNDNKNWWECRNAQSRTGYVPHTILSVVPMDHSPRANQDSYSQDRGGQPPSSLSPRAGEYNNFPSEPATVKSEQSLVDGIQSVKLRPIQQQQTIQRSRQKKLSKLIMEEQKYVPEMVDTIKRKRQLIGPRRIASIRGPPITVDSTVAQVQNWLTLKGFSDYVKSVLSRCNGEHLFRITRPQLLHYCGEEGNRLFSLLTVQKKRANYATGTEAQLRALLEFRRQHVDQYDEVSEPDIQPPTVETVETAPPTSGNTPAITRSGSVLVQPLDPSILNKQPLLRLKPTAASNETTAPVQNGTSSAPSAPKVAPFVPKAPPLQIVSIPHLPRAKIAQKPAADENVKPTVVPVNTQIPIERKGTIIEVAADKLDDLASDDTSESPRTRSLRTIAQTVKTYY